MRGTIFFTLNIVNGQTIYSSSFGNSESYAIHFGLFAQPNEPVLKLYSKSTGTQSPYLILNPMNPIAFSLSVENELKLGSVTNELSFTISLYKSFGTVLPLQRIVGFPSFLIAEFYSSSYLKKDTLKRSINGCSFEINFSFITLRVVFKHQYTGCMVDCFEYKLAIPLEISFSVVALLNTLPIASGIPWIF